MSCAAGFPIYLSLSEIGTNFLTQYIGLGEEKYKDRSGWFLAHLAKMKPVQYHYR